MCNTVIAQFLPMTTTQEIQDTTTYYSFNDCSRTFPKIIFISKFRAERIYLMRQVELPLEEELLLFQKQVVLRLLVRFRATALVLLAAASGRSFGRRAWSRVFVKLETRCLRLAATGSLARPSTALGRRLRLLPDPAAHRHVLAGRTSLPIESTL